MEYALVTASTAGIGYAVAERLLQEGYFCYINYAHDDVRANVASKRLSDISHNYKVIKADLSCIEGVEDLVKNMDDGAKLSYLVLNCGITDRTPFKEITLENWNNVINTNLTMPFFLLQGLFYYIKEGGSVVLISSILARYPHAASISYGVSKAALNALCQNMVKILAEKKIRINTLEPGFVETNWQKDKPPDQRFRIENKIALGRFAQPHEIADMCYSVLSNTYINGAIIPMCGGYCMS